jgi:23S rRNA (adenine2503-C2)-methyltransferase
MSLFVIDEVHLNQVEQLQSISRETFYETYCSMNTKENMDKYLNENLSISTLENELKNPNSLLPSIVFMGQGEPLHNFNQVKKAIEILNDPKLIGVGKRQMTLSTVGYLPGMQSLKEIPQINFALSLHSPFDDERQLLIPVNQRFPIDEVLKKFDELSFLKRQFLTIEYLLIKNFNMTEKHAEALQEKFYNKKIIINLIPFNPFPGTKWERPNLDEIENFKNLLVEKKLRVMVRRTKGDDILAACGQLKINPMVKNL